MSEWLPDDTGIRRDDPLGDDEQVGESYSVRFRRADLPGAIITQTAYPVNVGGDSKGPFAVRVETVWLVCRDPKDPGGTEISSDCRPEDEDELYDTAVEAERAARNLANELSNDAGSLTWDGLPDWEQGVTLSRFRKSPARVASRSSPTRNFVHDQRWPDQAVHTGCRGGVLGG